MKRCYVNEERAHMILSALIASLIVRSAEGEENMHITGMRSPLRILLLCVKNAPQGRDR